MKKKFLTALLLAGTGCAGLLSMTAGTDVSGQTAIREAQAGHQAAAFVEVLPQSEIIKEETVTCQVSEPEPEPEAGTESEPAHEKERNPEPELSYRDGLAAYITGVNETVTETEALNIADCMLEQAEIHDVDEKLILAVAHTESTYYSDAVSCVNYKGLMQTGDVLAEEAGYSPDALFDPEISIAVGTEYIRQQLDNFDHDISLALTAYNQGPGAVWEGNYDSSYADLTLERVENIENFLQNGGYAEG